MKTILYSFIAIIILTAVTKSQIFTEDFSYTGGTLLTANGWPAHSGVGTNAITVTGPGLTYTDYPGSGIGNAVILTTTGEDVNKSFTSQTGNSVYMSFLVNVTTSQTSGDYFIHLVQGPVTSNVFVGKVFVKKDASTTNFAFGVSKRNNSSTATYTGFDYIPGTTYLVVCKYVFNTGSITDDICYLFVNPTIPGSEPAPTLTSAIETGNDATSIDLIALRQGSNTAAPSLVVDGIRVAATWEEIPLPVHLTYFNSSVNENKVTLNWKTSWEMNNKGFEVIRNGLMIDFVPGKNVASTYSYYDNTPLTSGVYAYQIKQLDFNGNYEYYNLGNDVVIGTPKNLSLDQNYPNPANPSTTISYKLPTDMFVSLKVYDILGREVAVLVNEIKKAGYHNQVFNADNIASGMYFYTLTSSTNKPIIKKMMIVK